jgi:hypothetical protein
MIKRIFLMAAASMALAFPAMAGAQTVHLCTGSAGFPYNVAGHMIADASKGSPNVNIVVDESTGSVDNIRRTVEVDANDPTACQAFIGQPDALVFAKRKNPSLPLKQIGQLHREYLQILCNKESGVTDLKQLPGGKDAGGAYSLNVGKEGSGAWVIWQNFIQGKQKYASVPTKNESDKRALSSVSSGDTTCMLVAAGLNNSTMQEANDNYSDTLVMAEASDWSFNNALDIRGKPLYEFVDIPRTYKNLQGFFGGKRESVSWLAGVYVNPDRIDDKAYDDLVTYVNRAKSGIQDKFGK